MAYCKHELPEEVCGFCLSIATAEEEAESELGGVSGGIFDA